MLNALYIQVWWHMPSRVDLFGFCHVHVHPYSPLWSVVFVVDSPSSLNGIRLPFGIFKLFLHFYLVFCVVRCFLFVCLFVSFCCFFFVFVFCFCCFRFCLFVFVLCLACAMLPVSLKYPFLISPSVLYNS
jgi:hypothetical protein